MRTRITTLLLCAVLALVAGCATLSAPRPTPETPADDPTVIAVDTGGTIGQILCVGVNVALADRPDDIRRAQLSVVAAREVLSSPVPSFSALQAALEEGLPPQYAALAAVGVSNLRKQFGRSDLIPVGTAGYAAAEELLNQCALVLGVGEACIDIGAPATA